MKKYKVFTAGSQCAASRFLYAVGVEETGLLVGQVVIPSPHLELFQNLY